jgi:hypothetical protein
MLDWNQFENEAKYDADGEVRHDNITYVGDVVETKYGLCKIKKIEIMPEPRHYSKCGINVNKMFTSMLNYCIIDLDNNHFVYGDEVNNGNN